MSIKLALLKSGEQIISDAKELVTEEKIYGYLFTHPHVVDVRRPLLLVDEENKDKKTFSNIEISLSPWLYLSSDKKIPVTPDFVVTIVEPIDSLKQMYEEKINETYSQMSSVEE